MNFGSFKYFASQSSKRFSFNKNSFKMMSSSFNSNNSRFVSLFSNKIHLADRIRSLNNISKRCIGTSGVSTGNGMNIYNNPEISADLLSSGALLSESLLGGRFNMTSNILSMTVLNDYLLVIDGKL
jgi:hypothetical protein